MSGRATLLRLVGSLYSARTAALDAGFPGSRRLKRRRQHRICRWIPFTVSMPFRCRPDRHDGAGGCHRSRSPTPASVFLGVPRTDGGDQIGIVDATLEKTDPSPVLEAIDRSRLPPEVEARQPAGSNDPGRPGCESSKRWHPAKHGVRPVHRLRVDRRQAGLPVVGVDD